MEVDYQNDRRIARFSDQGSEHDRRWIAMGSGIESGPRTSQRRPTLKDVARAANVSMMTVSRVLKDSPHVSQSTRERVLAEIARLGYRPSFSARTLRAGESRLIGILAPNTGFG
jgi:hypothetical protein